MGGTHAPGPWYVSPEDGEVYSLTEYTSIAMVLMNERGEANGRLIAAAPELLEALIALRSACMGMVPKCADQVDAAIAKATE